jgi:hypothetical protein
MELFLIAVFVFPSEGSFINISFNERQQIRLVLVPHNSQTVNVDKKLENINFWFEFFFAAFNNHSTVDVGNISDSALI